MKSVGRSANRELRRGRGTARSGGSAPIRESHFGELGETWLEEARRILSARVTTLESLVEMIVESVVGRCAWNEPEMKSFLRTIIISDPELVQRLEHAVKSARRYK